MAARRRLAANRAARAAAFLQARGYRTAGSCGLETVKRQKGGQSIPTTGGR